MSEPVSASLREILLFELTDVHRGLSFKCYGFAHYPDPHPLCDCQAPWCSYCRCQNQLIWCDRRRAIDLLDLILPFPYDEREIVLVLYRLAALVLCSHCHWYQAPAFVNMWRERVARFGVPFPRFIRNVNDSEASVCLAVTSSGGIRTILRVRSRRQYRNSQVHGEAAPTTHLNNEIQPQFDESSTTPASTQLVPNPLQPIAEPLQQSVTPAMGSAVQAQSRDPLSTQPPQAVATTSARTQEVTVPAVNMPASTQQVNTATLQEATITRETSGSTQQPTSQVELASTHTTQPTPPAQQNPPPIQITAPSPQPGPVSTEQPTGAAQHTPFSAPSSTSSSTQPITPSSEPASPQPPGPPPQPARAPTQPNTASTPATTPKNNKPPSKSQRRFVDPRPLTPDYECGICILPLSEKVCEYPNVQDPGVWIFPRNGMQYDHLHWVWCLGYCGTSYHRHCMDQWWIEGWRLHGKYPTCPTCRRFWVK